MREQNSDRRGGIFQYAFVLALVGAAFWTGTLYAQVQYLRSGFAGTKVDAKVAGVEDVPEPEAEKPVVLADDQWKKLLDKPAAEVGDKDAKVVMVEFTDFQCPFCKRSFEQTWPQIKKDYVDSGKIKVVYRDLPLSFHPNAKPAALAARCAGDEDKYVEMHDSLFTNQDAWVNLGDPKEKFVEYAKEVGLNTGKFATCYDGKKYEKEVDADLALANEVGATGTPTFFINGKQVVGAQPMSVFVQAIDEALQ